MKQTLFPFEHEVCRCWTYRGALTLLIAASAAAQSMSARFPVTSTQIVATMQNRQLPTAGLQVTISAPITASIAEPILEIQTIALLNAHTAQIKLSCRNHAECLPFYASVSWPEQAVLPMISSSARSGVSSIQTQTAHTQPSVPAILSKFDNVAAESQTIRAGTAAMLSMDQDRVHVLVRVVCLEGGITGAKVRVTTPDHKQAYVAEIVSPTLLKGSF